MSEQIKHECGIALIRLLKPLSFYKEKYGAAHYGINKLYLLMEKQHNRGQDGAGVVSIKFDTAPGTAYINRHRSNSANAIKDVFSKINASYQKDGISFAGELLLGHLRYATYGGSGIESCHPFLRQNNWKTRNLVLAGNFNLTNVDELFDQLVDIGQHPREKTDTVTVLEKIGHFLDEENERLFLHYKTQGHDNASISGMIAKNMDVVSILKEASKKWDGGYTMAGMFGHGDAFVLRDPNGIRPAFYYKDEEVVVVTSERPVIQTAFNVPIEKIQEIKPGHALVIRKDGQLAEHEIIKPGIKKSCSFERIYFSRGSDASIYQERKSLGRTLTESVLKSINYDIPNTIFSYIPNTAEVAFIGLVDGVIDYMNGFKIKKITEAGGKLNAAELKLLLSAKPRVEKIPVKDAKLRTFIAGDNDRDEMAAHVYDTTYGLVKRGVDTLVVLDDSIVRGTTLKQSILRILDRLGPKKIVIVSSAPQIRYPDCYGINMSRMTEFIAFEAAITLLKENFKENFIEELYERAKAQEELPKENIKNIVKEIYAPFTDEQLSAKIALLLRPADLKAELEIIFQPIQGLRESCPDHTGDWYFTGDYPTPGGNKVVNRSFINFMEGKNVRAY